MHLLLLIRMSFLLFPQLDLQLQDEAGGDISSFVTNGEWDLLGKYGMMGVGQHYNI